MDFSVILQMFLLSMISIQYILIVALISFYLLTFFYLSVLAYSIGLQQYFCCNWWILRFTIFDASNELYLNVQNF